MCDYTSELHFLVAIWLTSNGDLARPPYVGLDLRRQWPLGPAKRARGFFWHFVVRAARKQHRLGPAMRARKFFWPCSTSSTRVVPRNGVVPRSEGGGKKLCRLGSKLSSQDPP